MSDEKARTYNIAYSKQYRENNPEKVRAKIDAWKEDNKEYIADYNKSYYEKHKERLSIQRKKRRLALKAEGKL